MNYAGISASLLALVRPAILRPALRVPTIAQLDLGRLKAEGVTGVVIDKDNCITQPHVDELAPGLERSWRELVETFGANNVLVVSNSAGVAAKDSLLLQAEAVSRNLLVPVLVHTTPKPGHKCVHAVANYFAPPPSTAPAEGWLKRRWRRGDEGAVVWCPRARAQFNERAQGPGRRAPSQGVVGAPVAWGRGEGVRPPTVLVVGDRLATDMILASRLAALRSPQPGPSQEPTILAAGPIKDDTPVPPIPQGVPRLNVVSVLTTQLHAREGLGTTFLRSLEKLSLWLLTRYKPATPSPFLDCVISQAPSAPTAPQTAASADELAGAAKHPRLSRALNAVTPRLERLIALWTRQEAPKGAMAAHLAWRSPKEEMDHFWRANEGVAERVVLEAEVLRSHGVVRELEERLEQVRRRVGVRKIELPGSAVGAERA